MAGAPATAKQFNKVAIRLAGHRAIPLWAVLRHRGRKSGAEYSVPVAVIPTDTAFIIALPWGRSADWVRNTRAAGGCDVRWKGHEFRCTEPEFVDKDVALAAAGPVLSRMLSRQDPEGGFLRLQRAPAPGRPAPAEHW